MSHRMWPAPIFLAAIGSVALVGMLGRDGMAANLVLVAWLLTPYVVLMAAMISAKRTSLLAIGIATLLGAVGALASVVTLTLLDWPGAERFVPIYQAGATVVLLRICKWLVARARK